RGHRPADEHLSAGDGRPCQVHESLLGAPSGLVGHHMTGPPGATHHSTASVQASEGGPSPRHGRGQEGSPARERSSSTMNPNGLHGAGTSAHQLYSTDEKPRSNFSEKVSPSSPPV